MAPPGMAWNTGTCRRSWQIPVDDPCHVASLDCNHGLTEKAARVSVVCFEGTIFRLALRGTNLENLHFGGSPI